MGKQNALYKLGVLVVLPLYPTYIFTLYQEMETLNSTILTADG